MLAFTNTTVTKPKIMAQLQAHYDADDFIKGTYWENGKGCAVGCTIHSSDHAEYEARFGIPQMLAVLEDCIFEGLPNDKAKEWPLRFMGAIRERSDLSTVGWKFQLWLQTENLQNAKRRKMPDDVQEAIAGVIPFLKILSKGEKLSAEKVKARSAAESAESAAESALWSARWSAWWSSARSAAESAESAAESALWSAAESAESAESAAENAARSAAENAVIALWSAERSMRKEEFYEKVADTLIEIIEAA